MTFLLLGSCGGIGFVLWNSPSDTSRGKERKIELPSPLEDTPEEDSKPEESYQDFEKSIEVGQAQSPDMEEENDRLPRETDVELVQIFKHQERKNLPPFTDQNLWKKNVQKRVEVPKGKPQVAVIIEGVEFFSAEDWKTLHKLTMPLTFIFSTTQPEGAQLALKAWKRGREIIVKGKPSKARSIQKEFPYMIGVLDEKPSSSLPSYLVLSRVKGLKEGLPHRLFSFPLVRDKKTFMRSNQSIVWVTYRRDRLRAFVEWGQQQKKSVVFVPISQFHAQETTDKKGIVIDIKRVEEARPNLG